MTGSLVWATGRKVDQARRLLNRQRPEQRLVEEGEDRRVRADPERQRNDRHGRHERGLEESAKGELEMHVLRSSNELSDRDV